MCNAYVIIALRVRRTYGVFQTGVPKPRMHCGASVYGTGLAFSAGHTPVPISGQPLDAYVAKGTDQMPDGQYRANTPHGLAGISDNRAGVL